MTGIRPVTRGAAVLGVAGLAAVASVTAALAAARGQRSQRGRGRLSTRPLTRPQGPSAG